MSGDDWHTAFPGILAGLETENARVDAPGIREGVTMYAVRSFDGDALVFSVPVLVRRQLMDEIPLDPRGSDGAVGLIIERIKQQALSRTGLFPLAGKGTKFPARYDATIEPCTIVHSDDAIGTHLWRPDNRNFCDADGIHLLLRGAIPHPAQCTVMEKHRIADTLAGLLDASGNITGSLPVTLLENAWRNSLDQKLLREQLADLGLVAFAGDGSHLARQFTHHRCFFRIAGRKEGVNIPFACPAELGPFEAELPSTGRTVTGLGIRAKEVFAVAGSNAQGKTTFLEGIIAGMDDHAAGDGRELVVTRRGLRIAEACTSSLGGADISMFFAALPPGIDGTVKAAYGIGSGSMVMAQQVQEAVDTHAPLLIIDEDRAAPNLLARSCLQKEEITPLAEILATDRDRMKDTALVFAACAMDTLIAQADRIMVFDRHAATGIDRVVFRNMVARMLRTMADRMAGGPGQSG